MFLEGFLSLCSRYSQCIRSLSGRVELTNCIFDLIFLLVCKNEKLEKSFVYIKNFCDDGRRLWMKSLNILFNIPIVEDKQTCTHIHIYCLENSNPQPVVKQDSFSLSLV